MRASLSLPSRYFPWLFVAAFAVVIAVNATMIVFAVGSFSGLYADHARETGLHYNQLIAQQKARDALGWTVTTAWLAPSRQLELTVRGPDGTPLADAEAHVDFVRPAEKRAAIAVGLQAVAPGRFAGAVDLPERGNWDLDIRVARAGQHYAITRRMFIK